VNEGKKLLFEIHGNQSLPGRTHQSYQFQPVHINLKINFKRLWN